VLSAAAEEEEYIRKAVKEFTLDDAGLRPDVQLQTERERKALVED
jgi:hypothetical protein